MFKNIFYTVFCYSYLAGSLCKLPVWPPAHVEGGSELRIRRVLVNPAGSQGLIPHFGRLSWPVTNGKKPYKNNDFGISNPKKHVKNYDFDPICKMGCIL